MLDILKFMFHKYTISNPIPYAVDYGLSVSLRNLIYYEMFAIFSPQDIKIDIFELCKLRSHGLTTAYFSPCGTIKNNFKQIENAHFGYWKKQRYCHDDRIRKFMTKVYKQYHKKRIDGDQNGYIRNTWL